MLPPLIYCLGFSYNYRGELRADQRCGQAVQSLFLPPRNSPSVCPEPPKLEVIPCLSSLPPNLGR